LGEWAPLGGCLRGARDGPRGRPAATSEADRMLEELKRKAIHLTSLVIPVGYYFLPETTSRRALLIAVLVAIIIEAVRLNEPRVGRMTLNLAGALLRESEKTNLFGSTYLILGSLLCAYSFEKAVVVAAVSFLILGDAAAALVGRAFGRISIFGKTLEGSLACFAVCMIIGAGVLRLPFSVSAGGALAATIFELFPIPLDDNLRIPLAAGFAMQLLMQ